MLLPLLLFWSLSFGSVARMWRQYHLDRAKVLCESALWKDRERHEALAEQQRFFWLKKPKQTFVKSKRRIIFKKSKVKSARPHSALSTRDLFIKKRQILTQSAGISSSARLDLPSALKTARGRQILSSLIRDLYQKQRFFQTMKEQHLNFVDELIDELKIELEALLTRLEGSSHEIEDFANTDWLMLLLRGNRRLREPFCQMLAGGPHWPSLRLFISLELNSHRSKIDERSLMPVYLQHALPALQKALLGPDVFDDFATFYQSQVQKSLCDVQESQEQKVGEWKLVPQVVMSRKMCSNLLKDILKKRGLRMGDLPAKGALRFDAHCPPGRDLILAKENGHCLTLKIEPMTKDLKRF